MVGSVGFYSVTVSLLNLLRDDDYHGRTISSQIAPTLSLVTVPTQTIDPPPTTVDTTSLSPPPEPSPTPAHRRSVSWRGVDVEPCWLVYDLKVWVEVLRFRGFGSVVEREEFPEDFDEAQLVSIGGRHQRNPRQRLGFLVSRRRQTTPCSSSFRLQIGGY